RLALADRKGDVVDRIDLTNGAPQYSLLDREMLFQVDDLEHRGAVVAGAGRRLGTGDGGRVASHKAAPSASRPPSGPGVSARRAERTSGSGRRQTDSAAQTNSPAAGWSRPAPGRGSLSAGHSPACWWPPRRP